MTAGIRYPRMGAKTRQDTPNTGPTLKPGTKNSDNTNIQFAYFFPRQEIS